MTQKSTDKPRQIYTNPGNLTNFVFFDNGRLVFAIGENEADAIRQITPKLSENYQIVNSCSTDQPCQFRDLL